VGGFGGSHCGVGRTIYLTEHIVLLAPKKRLSGLAHNAPPLLLIRQRLALVRGQAICTHTGVAFGQNIVAAVARQLGGLLCWWGVVLKTKVLVGCGA
jgi:hypothetical protein